MKDQKTQTVQTTLSDQIWSKLKELPMPVFGIPRNLADTFSVKPNHPDILCLTSNIPAAIAQLEELVNTFRIKTKTNTGTKEINVFDFNVNREYINISVNKTVVDDPNMKKEFNKIMKMNWLGASAVLKQKDGANV